MTGASGALILWQWKEELGKAFVFPIVAFLVVGFLHRWTLAQGVQNLGMTVLLPTVIIIFGLVIYYWFTIRSLKRIGRKVINRKKKWGWDKSPGL